MPINGQIADQRLRPVILFIIKRAREEKRMRFDEINFSFEYLCIVKYFYLKVLILIAFNLP